MAGPDYTGQVRTRLPDWAVTGKSSRLTLDRRYASQVDLEVWAGFWQWKLQNKVNTLRCTTTSLPSLSRSGVCSVRFNSRIPTAPDAWCISPPPGFCRPPGVHRLYPHEDGGPRQEFLLYGNESMYRVHIAFPGTFAKDALILEHAAKPELLKKMEGSHYPVEELAENTQSAEEIAAKTLRGIHKGHYQITTDLLTDITLNNMRGPSPRDNPLYDVVMSFLGLLVWPFMRRKSDRMTVQHGRENSLRK